MDLKSKPNCKKANAAFLSEKENISFYKVPLVCGAAPQIGCGSKAKPVLLGLEKKSVVQEAWLNRAGTVIAIVWNNNASSEFRGPAQTADAIFKENKMDVELLSGKEHKKMLADFQEKKKWYRGEEVNKLSMEEADIIAARLVKRIHQKAPLSQEKMQSLKIEFANVFKSRFTSNYSSEINSNESDMVESLKQQTENQLWEIGKKYLNETEMSTLKGAIALGLRPTESEKRIPKDIV